MTWEAKLVGKNIVITIPLSDGKPSASGKMNLLATSNGFADTGITHKGKPLKLNLNLGYSNK